MKKVYKSTSSLHFLRECRTIAPGQVQQGDDNKGRPLRLIATLSLPMFLAACGVPTGISVVGYVADGLSAGASGKTVNDHLISQIMNMDCGLLRFLSGDWIL